jgi:hypothetical protein
MLIVILAFTLGVLFGFVVASVLSAADDVWEMELRQIEEEEEEYVDREQGSEQREVER